MDGSADIQQQEAMPPDQFVAYVAQSDNLVDDLPEGRLAEIADQVLSDYKTDKDSMSDWHKKMQRGLELAALVKKDKTYPFKDASNVKFPLVTSAALQFNARAYPAIVAPDRVVKAKVWGSDQAGEKAARADRISEHMSFQLTAEIEEWEEDTDRLLKSFFWCGRVFPLHVPAEKVFLLNPPSLLLRR